MKFKDVKDGQHFWFVYNGKNGDVEYIKMEEHYFGWTVRLIDGGIRNCWKRSSYYTDSVVMVYRDKSEILAELRSIAECGRVKCANCRVKSICKANDDALYNYNKQLLDELESSF